MIKGRSIEALNLKFINYCISISYGDQESSTLQPFDFFLCQICHFAYIWLVQFQSKISNSEHNLPRSRLAMDSKLLNAAKSEGTFMVPKTQDWCKLNWNLPG